MATAMQSTRVAILGVDVGGTFTDAVLLDGGRVRTAKVPTAERQEESVLAAARAVGAENVVRFAHGTTVATNALLERRGARTAFVGNDGFEHLLHLRRQTRAHLYRLCDEHPAPLVPLERCHGVQGRLGPDCELEPLDLSTLPDIGDAETVAVCLLFAFRDPSHEQAVAAELRQRHPGVHVVASHEVAPEFREYERASTTVADAYLAPVAARYLHALAASAQEAGLPEPLVMLSSGGVASVNAAASHPATILVSGPAGGVVGAGLVARRAGFEQAIAFDMGGTSTDVCLLPGGRAARVAERVVGGFPIRLPTVDLHTVGAGGGSLVTRDAGGAIRVGPESAGAHPGPACYGAGGGATVTDANLLLGRLPAELPGGLVLDRAAAERALGDIDPQAVIDVVNAEMLRALRVVSVERGHDPRDFALVAFGGAGPLHACALAEELGIEAVLVPEAAGVLSALGLIAGDERRDSVVSYVHPLAEVNDLPADGEADLRYRGQSFELTVPLQRDLATAFHRAHEERYGYADPEREIELVAVRTAEVTPGPDISLASNRPLQGRGAGAGGASRRDVLGSGRLERRDERRRDAGAAAMNVELQVIGSSLRAVAEEMGAVLIRSAFSANIKERRDCSTAIFDEAGRMVAQAEHIPVHLGAMPDAVAAAMTLGLSIGQVCILNDPYTGGTHLPDITLISRTSLGYAVSRAHHADVGGMEPASLPAFSRELYQEGLIIPPTLLTDEVERLFVANARNPDERRGDLRAQISAHRLAERRIDELCERRGRERVAAAMDELYAYSERMVRAAISRLPDGTWSAEDVVEAVGRRADDPRDRRDRG